MVITTQLYNVIQIWLSPSFMTTGQKNTENFCTILSQRFNHSKDIWFWAFAVLVSSRVTIKFAAQLVAKNDWLHSVTLTMCVVQASERGQGGMLLANDVAEDGDGKDSDYISPEVLGLVISVLATSLCLSVSPPWLK